MVTPIQCIYVKVRELITSDATGIYAFVMTTSAKYTLCESLKDYQFRNRQGENAMVDQE